MTSSYHTEIGKLLKNAREELGMTLPQSSAALHIRAHYLHALEEGDLADLPGAAYTKGYLQSYAVFLHLDKNEILRRFELVKSDIPEKGFFFPQVLSKEKKPSSSVVWSGGLLVLVVYMVWYMAFKPNMAVLTVVAPPSGSLVGTSGEESIAVDSIFNLSCAVPQVRVYPSCYRVENGKILDNSLLPLHRQIISVMELAY